MKNATRYLRDFGPGDRVKILGQWFELAWRFPGGGVMVRELRPDGRANTRREALWYKPDDMAVEASGGPDDS